MGERQMKASCNSCGQDFWVSMEYLTPEALKKLADDTRCPTCGSRKWRLTDTCSR